MHKLFASQLDNEHIYLVIRQHWFFLVTRLAVIGILIVVGVAARVFGPELAPFLFEDELGIITGLVFHTYWLVVLLSTFLIVIFYYLHLQIITDVRLVDIDQIGLFGRNVSELQLENVEDVTSQMHGVFATVLNFGDVLVQTSSPERFFDFDGIAHPELVKKMILDLYEARRENIEPNTKETRVLNH